MNHLLSNSLRYGRDGGMIDIGVREEDERVWVDVWGRGISEMDLPHIFEHLYTGKASRNAISKAKFMLLASQMKRPAFPSSCLR
ncbi:sensor histidine kinase [Paenibacillus sp. SYP-B3998]|uniref:Sensor histidine kinase n=2 Tax=Paenibacillus sp. SYP-B3998 TaxID=2678564 RepID=A0A6G3ZYQ1_9BACL|nr:sensor histidine kinase [Paenibacillus sp. SYP-B3998]